MVFQHGQSHWHQQKGDTCAGAHHKVNGSHELAPAILGSPLRNAKILVRKRRLNQLNEGHQVVGLGQEYGHLQQRGDHLQAVHQGLGTEHDLVAMLDHKSAHGAEFKAGGQKHNAIKHRRSQNFALFAIVVGLQVQAHAGKSEALRPQIPQKHLD